MKNKVKEASSKPEDLAFVRALALPPKKNTATRLKVGNVIGQGGMSNIEEIFDLNLLRTAARKVIKPESAEDESEKARLVEEAQVTAQLDHPNIVPVHELGMDSKGTLYFSMKKVSGQTFTQILMEKSPNQRTEGDLFEYLQIFLKICDAVAFAHSRGVIHRDIKPDNVMVGEFGEVYLMDWGFAKLKERWSPSKEDLKEIGHKRRRYKIKKDEKRVTATLYYMAPEAASTDPDAMDERSDIFCLGGILYKILTQRPPFFDNNMRDLAQSVFKCRIKPPKEIVDIDLPQRLVQICMKALKPRKEDRYQVVGDLKRDVESFLQCGWQFQRKHFKKGDIVVKEGDPGDEAYVITTGRCRVFKTEDSKINELGYLGVGDVFGEISVFARNPRSASVECVEKTTVMVITRKNFEEDLGMSFWLGLFAKALAERFTESQQKIIELERALVKTLPKMRKIY